MQKKILKYGIISFLFLLIGTALFLIYELFIFDRINLYNFNQHVLNMEIAYQESPKIFDEIESNTADLGEVAYLSFFENDTIELELTKMLDSLDYNPYNYWNVYEDENTPFPKIFNDDGSILVIYNDTINLVYQNWSVRIKEHIDSPRMKLLLETCNTKKSTVEKIRNTLLKSPCYSISKSGSTVKLGYVNRFNEHLSFYIKSGFLQPDSVIKKINSDILIGLDYSMGCGRFSW